MNEYVAKPMETWMLWHFGVSTILTGFFLLTFAQSTVRRIEKQIKKDKALYVDPVDFGGSKIINFAYVIVFPERFALRIERLIDVNVIRHYANKRDWWLGLFFILISHQWIAIILITSIFT